MELPEEMAEKVREENYEPTYGALEYEDKMYGIPLEYNIEYGGMLVNDTLLKAKGLTVPKTWKNFVKRQSKEQSTTAIFSSAKVLIL